MSEATKVLAYTVDLNEPIRKAYLDTLFATEDSGAHRIEVTLRRGVEKVTLPAGAAVNAYFIRYADNATVPITGTVSRNTASVTLTKACYNKAGQFALIIKVSDGSSISTVFYGEGTMFASSTDTVIDNERVIPTLSELLAQIAAMEAANKAASKATADANAATQRATDAASGAEGAAQHAANAASAAEKWADATATAQTLAPGSAATVAIGTGSDGKKQFAFGIPRGDTGAQGPQGDKGEKGEPGKDGTGAGTVTSVNNVAPNDWGNVTIGTTEIGWGKRNIAGNTSPIAAAMSPIVGGNKAELCNAAGVTIEYSRDGGATWQDYGASDETKIALMSSIGAEVYIGKRGNAERATADDMLRVTINAAACGVYTWMRCVLINLSTEGASGPKCKIEFAKHKTPEEMVLLGEYTVDGWSGWNEIPTDAPIGGSEYHNYNNYLRMTYSIDAASEENLSNMKLVNILLIGDTSWITPSNLAKTGHLYSYDAWGNATFPADVMVKGMLNGKATDSGKLGGKAPEYYIQPHNLLDNSDFCNVINQRGGKSYDGTGYAFDRWRVWNKDTVTVNEQGAAYNGITVSGVLFQYLEKAYAKNSTYTLAACLTDGTIRVISRNPRADYWFNDKSQLGLGLDNNIIVVALGTGTYRWAALYEGVYTAETLPPYVPKGYAAELAECQRYYLRYKSIGCPVTVWGSSTTQAAISLCLPSPMRTSNYTVTIDNIELLIDGAGNNKSLESYTPLNNDANSTCVRVRLVATDAWTKGDVGTLIADVAIYADL